MYIYKFIKVSDFFDNGSKLQFDNNIFFYFDNASSN